MTHQQQVLVCLRYIVEVENTPANLEEEEGARADEDPPGNLYQHATYRRQDLFGDRLRQQREWQDLEQEN